MPVGLVNWFHGTSASRLWQKNLVPKPKSSPEPTTSLDFDHAGRATWRGVVLLTAAPSRCITPRFYELDHRPDGENMRTRQRLIDIEPLVSSCLISFSGDIAKVRTARPVRYLNRTRSIHRDGLRGDPVTKTFYRKLPSEKVWHFCRNCEHWPRSGYEQRDSSDPPYSFCNGCIQMHRDGKCEWFHEEASPPKRS